MKRLHYFVAGGCLALIIAVPAASSQAQGITGDFVEEPVWQELRLADNEVLGVVDPGGIFVTALETEPGAVGFVVDLGNGVLFEGTEDHVGGLLSLRVVDAEGLPHAIEGPDLELLARVYRALVLQPEIVDLAAADSLLRFLNWIADAPLGTTLDLQIALPATLATSLCKKVGKNVTAYWDHTGGSSSKVYSLGPCAQGACMGRCGQGCGDGFGPAYAVQQFTQDCLNHDACVAAFGYTAPSCQDEFLATADDAAVAMDCNEIAGVWKIRYKTTPDTNNRKIDFSMKKKGKFTGKAHVARDRYVTIKGKRENPPPLLKGATIKVPLWMNSGCGNASLGFAKATIVGVNYCGKIRGRLVDGTWPTYRTQSCSTNTAPWEWTGKVVLKRKTW